MLHLKQVKQNTTIMITRNQIIKFAELKGVKFYEYFPSSDESFYSKSISEFTAKQDNEYKIGVEGNNGGVFWFSAYVTEMSEIEAVFNGGEGLFFSHRYSTNSGTTIKGFSTGWNFEKKVHALTA